MSGPQRRQAIGWVAVAVLVVTFAVDVSFESVMLIPLVYVIVVAVTALTAGPRATGIIATVAFVLALLAGFANGDHTSKTYWLRVAVVCVAAVIALAFSIVLAERGRRIAAESSRYQLIAENASDVVLVWGADRRLTWASPSIESILGWKPEDVIGSDATALLDDTEIARVQAYHRDVYARGDTAGRMEVQYRAADGGHRWMSVAGKAQLADDGTVIGGIESLRDVQNELDARNALVESEAQYRLLAENTSDVVIRWGVDARLEWVTPTVEAVLGWQPRDLIGRSITTLMHPEDLVRIGRFKEELLARGETDGSIEARYATAAGDWRWMAVRGHAILDADGLVIGGIEGLRDIEVEHAYREQLHFLAEHDSLSQLVNRGEFLSQMGTLLAHRPRSGTRIAFLFIDIDDFKAINDERGHEAGDAVITEFARRVGACVRSADVVARYGSDEFVVALTAVHGVQDAEVVAAKVHESLREPIVLNSHSIAVTVSIGVSLVEQNGTLDDALRRADRALYAAKDAGRNRTLVYAGTD